MSTTPRKKIFMGILSTRERLDVHTYLFRDLQERYSDRVELVFADNCVHYFPHDFARNSFTEEFLESDCDAMWFLDSDVVPPRFILDLVVNHWDKWQVAGAPYPLWMTAPGASEPAVLFTTYSGVVTDENGKPSGIHMNQCPREGQEYVDALATGCMFIKREVFDKIERPYFEFKFDPKTRKLLEGEDLGFCLKLNQAGIRCLIDYSMVCKHFKTLDLLDLNNYAVSFANRKVLEYDHEIRKQIEDAIEKACDLAYKKGVDDAQSKRVNFDHRFKAKAQSGLILPSNY